MNFIICKIKSEIANKLKDKDKDYMISHHIIYNDSMESEIFSGDEVVVDESVKMLNVKDVFLFKDSENENIIGRCKLIGKEWIRLYFNNENCKAKEFHISELSLVGKVILAGLNYIVLASDLCSLNFSAI